MRDWSSHKSESNACAISLFVQSWLCGKVIGFLEPASMDLHESRGHETPRSKLWMRLSVLSFDLAGNSIYV